MKQTRSFIGMDVHKETISISVAEDGRTRPVRFIDVIPNTEEDVAKMAKRLSKHGELDFCYEACGCGYGSHRQLTALRHRCSVVAPSLIPRKPGERIKTDRRDSEKLAILHRSGDLTPVWVPDTTHETLRDLVRARVDASMHLMRARQQCSRSCCAMVVATQPASTGHRGTVVGLQDRYSRASARRRLP